MFSNHDVNFEMFIKLKGEGYRKSLERIVRSFLETCRYRNGESLERHNWGSKVQKLDLTSVPLDMNICEELLMKALDLNIHEKAVIEALWGDVQSGKRLHMLILMWYNIHILNKSVLLIFRNLNIDKDQLNHDITGNGKYDFNIQYIKSVFEKFHNELVSTFETGEDFCFWTEFKLPELKDTKNEDNLSRLGNKHTKADLYCGLMNVSTLTRINEQLTREIMKNGELVNITVIVDESDMFSCTSSNDNTNKRDKTDTTLCEKLIGKIYKKVKYALHVTGTVHSILYNTNTKLSDDIVLRLPVSQVHKMKLADNYYGLFNDGITFETNNVQDWWEYVNETTNKKHKYNIIDDYNINIDPIIKIIKNRTNVKYNSFLINEDDKRCSHLKLAYKIIHDHPGMFIIIYNGISLKLYLPKKYENEIKKFSEWDSKECSNKRLWHDKGVYGSSKNRNELLPLSILLPNDYCYFDIDNKDEKNTNISKKKQVYNSNIKQIYKLLRILFEKSEIKIDCKTVITITGKYGERGYSFTSDDYGDFSFHITDQYFISHCNLNCTDISQSIRAQGKYSDIELTTGEMNIRLWTTPKIKDIMMNFYVPFIKRLERDIMDAKTNDEIRYIIERIMDNGDMKFSKYVKYIDVKKKCKNLSLQKHYEKKSQGCGLIDIKEISDNEISEWCRQHENVLPSYICVNEVTEIHPMDIEDVHKVWYCELKEIDYNSLETAQHTRVIDQSKEEGYKRKYQSYITKHCIESYKTLGKQNTVVTQREIVIIVDDLNKRKYKGEFLPEKYKLKNKNIEKNPFRNINGELTEPEDIVYKDIDNRYWLSSAKEEYKNNSTSTLPRKYYWKTANHWLYFYDEDHSEITSINILVEKERENQESVVLRPVTNVTQENHTMILVTDVIQENVDNGVLQFTQSCFKKTEIKNLRIGISDIYEFYKTWCSNNNKKKSIKRQKVLKEELKKLNFEEEDTKGIDLNNNRGKRGYNIMVSL